MSVQRTYRVIGMTCDHCVHSVTMELSKVDGMGAVAVDLASGEVTVTSDNELPLDAVRAAVDEAGYELAAAS